MTIAAYIINTKTGETTYARTTDGKCWMNGSGDPEALAEAEAVRWTRIEDAIRQLVG